MSQNAKNNDTHIIKIVTRFKKKTPYKPKNDKVIKLKIVEKKNNIKPKINQE